MAFTISPDVGPNADGTRPNRNYLAQCCQNDRTISHLATISVMLKDYMAQDGKYTKPSGRTGVQIQLLKDTYRYLAADF